MKRTRMKLLLPDGVSPAGRNIAFISYRHKDFGYIDSVIELLLKETNFAIWYDNNLTAGEKFDDEIRDAINRSIVMIQIVTPSYFESSSYTIEQELPYAKSAGLKTVAICIDSSVLGLTEVMKHNPDYICSLDNPDSVAIFLSALRAIDTEVSFDEQIRRCVKKQNRAYMTPEDMFLLAQLYAQGCCKAIGLDEAIRFARMADLCGVYGANNLVQNLECCK